MYNYHSLFQIASVSIIALTLPALSSAAQQLFDVPANGVDCATPKEQVHTLTSEMISAAMKEGTALALKRYPVKAGALQYPQQFSPSMIGKDEQDRVYTIISNPKCKSWDDAWAYPIQYSGTVLPPDTTDNQAPSPQGSTVTPDLVIFQVELQEGATQNDLRNGELADVTFCSILTNSDAPTEQAFVVDGKVNEKRGGWHQCNANAV